MIRLRCPFELSRNLFPESHRPRAGGTRLLDMGHSNPILASRTWARLRRSMSRSAEMGRYLAQDRLQAQDMIGRINLSVDRFNDKSSQLIH